jgi:hypothetical protein
MAKRPAPSLLAARLGRLPAALVLVAAAEFPRRVRISQLVLVVVSFSLCARELASRRCPIRVSTCPSSLPTPCCQFKYRRCCVPRCVLVGCRLLYPSTHACLWLALALARLLVVTVAHSLFVHRASRVLTFAVELLDLSFLARDFVVARALTGFVSSPARSKFDLIVFRASSRNSKNLVKTKIAA